VAEAVELRLAEGLGVAWDRSEGELPAWRLSGSLDGFSLLRVVTGAGEDGSALRLCAARPDGAEHHDEELVAATVVSADGEMWEIEEALLSTEYAADGSVQRLGLELYRSGDDYPIRAAGDASSTTTGDDGRRRAELRFRMSGSAGAGTYEIVHPA
jgi:hypothetical protein